MDLLTVILIAVAAFVIFILLTAYLMKSTLYMNKELEKAKLKKEAEGRENDTAKKIMGTSPTDIKNNNAYFGSSLALGIAMISLT